MQQSFQNVWQVTHWRANKYDAGVGAEQKTQTDTKTITEHKYHNVLGNVHSIRMKLRMQQAKASMLNDELKKQVEVKKAKAIETRDAYQNFKRAVADKAVYSRTGKQIPRRVLNDIEEFEVDKDAEVEEVRTSNITLKNKFAKLETALRKKDELAENLHVIDFEQLKIENQTLNEKIEERNEELHKLRKKTIVTVQMMTHLREKLHFLTKSRQHALDERQQMASELMAQREQVAQKKNDRDHFRGQNAKFKSQTGVMNAKLMKDFNHRVSAGKTMRERVRTFLIDSKFRSDKLFLHFCSIPMIFAFGTGGSIQSAVRKSQRV